MLPNGSPSICPVEPKHEIHFPKRTLTVANGRELFVIINEIGIFLFLVNKIA